MFGNFSLPELLIVGAIALIVIGPKDLPRMMRSVGKFVGQARGMARQFQRSMDDAAREVDLAEFKEARTLMDKKASTKALTDTLSETVGLDDDEEKVEAPKSPVMSSAEMKETLKTFTGDPETSSTDPAPTPQTAEAEMEPAKASQG